jgi:hypothetical protein
VEYKFGKGDLQLSYRVLSDDEKLHLSRALANVPDGAALAVAGGDNIERHVDDKILAVCLHLYRDKAPYVIGYPWRNYPFTGASESMGFILPNIQLNCLWTLYLRDFNFFHHLLRDVGYTFATLSRGPNLNHYLRGGTDLE